jgi:prolyl-tRNA synthetase
MSRFTKKEITKKSENISEWYSDVVLKAELADYAPVKGTMVIRPYGYAIWEKVQEIFNVLMKKKGVQNAYFPLFIPHSLLEKEKEHVKGFSPELAVVTIGGGEELKDPLVVRPTSETIMYAMYSDWIQSWRDLPVLINQWNNVVRWEKRTYLFLRTTEFLWQEGHTAHEDEAGAIDMATTALEWYRKIYEEYLAIPVLLGMKSEKEKFAGAKATYSVELLMPDGKALQGATSHNLGQNFSKVFDIVFQNREGKNDFVWQTSWGLSTRSLGGLFLTHGDDNGLVLPPKIAPYQVVIIPILTKEINVQKLGEYLVGIRDELEKDGIRVQFDPNKDFERTESLGRIINKWELKGIPVRLEIGMKEIDDDTVTVARRDTMEKQIVKRSEIIVEIKSLLNKIQDNLFEKSKKFLEDNTHTVSSYEEFKKIMETNRGFIRAFWCENEECETKIQEESKASIRCLPLNTKVEDGKCVYCGEKAAHRWLFAQAY